MLDEKLLKKAIQETLENRGTEFTLIPEPTEAFNVKWNRFVKKNVAQLELSEVIREINKILNLP